MITTLNISPDELTIELLEQIKKMFAGSARIQIEIRNSFGNNLYAEETREEYKGRVQKAINNLKNKENISSFSEKEFSDLSDNLLKI